MAFNLRNRSFTKLLDFTPEEIRFLLKLSADLKAAKYGGYEQPTLTGKNIALIFEKSSTRTRISFEVAAYDQGAKVTYLGPSGSHIGHKETMKDTARVLGRVYDGIEYRGFAQDNVEILAKYSGVPVWNGLTNEFHPTQILADVLTMTEHTYKDLPDIAFCFLGDARNNMGNSLMVGGCKLGMDVRLCAPEHLWPEEDLVETCKAIAARTSARLRMGRTRQATQALPGQCPGHGADWQPRCQVHALLAGLPQRRDHGGSRDLRKVRAGGHGGHRGRL
jgi:ornithine carbamoyltransferase